MRRYSWTCHTFYQSWRPMDRGDISWSWSIKSNPEGLDLKLWQWHGRSMKSTNWSWFPHAATHPRCSKFLPTMYSTLGPRMPCNILQFVVVDRKHEQYSLTWHQQTVLSWYYPLPVFSYSPEAVVEAPEPVREKMETTKGTRKGKAIWITVQYSAFWEPQIYLL